MLVAHDEHEQHEGDDEERQRDAQPRLGEVLVNLREDQPEDQHAQRQQGIDPGGPVEISDHGLVTCPDVPGRGHDRRRDGAYREDGEANMQPEHEPIGERHVPILGLGRPGAAAPPPEVHRQTPPEVHRQPQLTPG